jgi:hypothetical protein
LKPAGGRSEPFVLAMAPLPGEGRGTEGGEPRGRRNAGTVRWRNYPVAAPISRIPLDPRLRGDDEVR